MWDCNESYLVISSGFVNEASVQGQLYTIATTIEQLLYKSFLQASTKNIHQLECLSTTSFEWPLETASRLSVEGITGRVEWIVAEYLKSYIIHWNTHVGLWRHNMAPHFHIRVPYIYLYPTINLGVPDLTWGGDRSRVQLLDCHACSPDGVPNALASEPLHILYACQNEDTAKRLVHAALLNSAVKVNSCLYVGELSDGSPIPSQKVRIYSQYRKLASHIFMWAVVHLHPIVLLNGAQRVLSLILLKRFQDHAEAFIQATKLGPQRRG